MLNFSFTRRFWKNFSITWLWKISMWPLNYQHILASVIRYVRTKWVAPNKCCGTFFVHWFSQVYKSITASKKNVVVFFQFEYADSTVMFTFSDFDCKYHFWVNLVQNNQTCQFILKFGTWTNSSMQNSTTMFNFSAFSWNYPFWANLVQLIKIVRLSWNLVPRLIRIRRI